MATLRNLCKRLEQVKQQAQANNRAQFRSIIVIENDTDVQEVEAAKKAGARVYIICGPEHGYLLGGSIGGAVVVGGDNI